MSVLADFASAVIGFVAVAVVLLLMRHLSHAPQKAHPWIRRFNIILMWAAGAVFAASGVEGLAVRVTGDVTGFIGGQYAPIINVAIVIGALFLVAGTLVALVWAPEDSAAFSALAVPLLLGLVAGGVLHGLYEATVAPGQQLAAAVNSWLAG
jgi:hypothetical protein